MTAAVKAIAFNLRPARDEKHLSFYLGDGCPAERLLAGAPGPGWGILTIRAGDARSIGFAVAADPDPSDPVCGAAHTSLAPPLWDSGGQIPLDLRERLAARASWLVEPVRLRGR